MNECSKVARYKINNQKSVAFLYTNRELLETEIKKIMQFTVASKKIPRNKFNQGGKRPITWKTIGC